MRLLPIVTSTLRAGDDLAGIISEVTEFRENDIVVVSSKAIATVEGAAIDLASLTVTDEARKLAQECGNTPEYRQAMLEEIKRLHGKIVGKSRYAVLTEVKPDGLGAGSILIASAGLDQSNVEDGKAIGWPRDPVASAHRLRDALKKKTGHTVAVVMSDSCCSPRRIGVTAIALACVGIDPFKDERGTNDLYGKPLKVTCEARADQLATAANVLMGNAGQSIPAVMIRDHDLELSDFEGWVPGIDPVEDLFACMF